MRILVLVAIFALGSAPASEPPLDKAELRALVDLVNRLPGSEATPDRFEPRDMIAAVNALHTLDKEETLRVLRNSPGRARIVVMRFLFTMPEMHPVIYWQTIRGTPEYPMLPAVVIEGVPFYIPQPGSGTGNAPSSFEYMEWYRESGTLRTDPLRPLDDPLQVWQAWLDSDVREHVGRLDSRSSEKADRSVQEQLLRMVDSIHARDFDEDTLRREDISMLWARAVETLTRTETRWDSETNRYVAADGSSLPPHVEPKYAAVSWTLPVEGRSAHLHIHRLDEETVQVRVYQNCRDAPEVPDMMVLVYAADNPSRVVAEMKLNGSDTNGTSWSVRTVTLEKGIDLRATFFLDEKAIAETEVLSPDNEVDKSKD